MNVDLVQLAGHRGRLHERPTVDQVTAEVVRGAMETICFEMATYVSRTATTPILNQSNERNATILDAKGRLAALSVGIPQFMLTSTLPVRFALEYLGVDEFHEGDVFAANDPYHGGGHLPDYNVFAPVFADVDDGNGAHGGRRMVLIASIQCHHGDTRGGVPGGDNITANDIWGEGVRWPVVKVIDRGVERHDVLYALQANNRIPGYIGDLRAQIGAAQLAVDRLGDMIDRYGAETVEESVDSMIDYAAGRFREEVASWPAGVYEADAYVDHDPLGNPDIRLHVTIIVGVDPRTGQTFTDHSAEVYAGWCNAAKGMDAWGAQNASFGNLWKATAEINESLYPHVQWSRDYRTDSGGPGQWRGLCGSHYEKEVLVDAKVYTYVVGMKYPMSGISGGEPGAPNELIIRYGSDDPYRVEHTADWVPVAAGQRVMYDYGGGGGWGDPLDRDPQAVLD